MSKHPCDVYLIRVLSCKHIPVANFVTLETKTQLNWEAGRLVAWLLLAMSFFVRSVLRPTPLYAKANGDSNSLDGKFFR